MKQKCLPKKVQRNLGLGRMITDSWPFESTLGELLLDFEKKYQKLP
jgi:hypothetical protein